MALTDKLTNLGNVIRDKTGGTELLTIEDMAIEVSSLPVIKKGITWDEFDEEGWVTEATLYTTETKIPDDAFACTKDNYGYYGVYSRLNTLNLPSNITHVGAYAFQDCRGITTFNFDNIETMGNGAFKGCTNISYLIFPNTLNNIGDNALIAAGTTVTEDVGDNDLCIARSRQTNKKGWVLNYKNWKQ